MHWVGFNLPADTRELSHEIPVADLGATEGTNSWGRTGYGGPCPPSGSHRYYFKLYALDTKLDLDATAKKEGVVAAMHGHVLEEAQLMGRYERK